MDDHQGVTYCYVHRVACTNWKCVMIVLSKSLLGQQRPLPQPPGHPTEHVHNSSTYLTFHKFWHC